MTGETKCGELESPEALPHVENNEEVSPAVAQERCNSADINRVPSNEKSSELISGSKKSNSLMTSIRSVLY